jgi:hypothetical protein
MLGLSVVWPAACSADEASDTEADAATEPTPTTAQPAASNPEAAFPVAENIVLEATELANELFQNPSVVDDEGSATLARFDEIYTEDSPTPAGVIAQLRALNDNGERYRPGPSGVLRDLDVYRMTAVDDDTIRLRVCAVEDVEVVDESGTVVATRSQITQGDGGLRRSDGVWRFIGIDPDETATLPIAPGSAGSGFCSLLLGGTSR